MYIKLIFILILLPISSYAGTIRVHPVSGECYGHVGETLHNYAVYGKDSCYFDPGGHLILCTGNHPKVYKETYYAANLYKWSPTMGWVYQSRPIPGLYIVNTTGDVLSSLDSKPLSETHPMGCQTCPSGQEWKQGANGWECQPICPEGEEETVCGCRPICPSGQRMVPGCECIRYCPYSNGRTPGLISSPYGGLCVEPPCSNYEITNPDGTCTHNCTVAGQQMDVTTGECFTPEVKCGPCETKVGNDCLAPDVCPQGQHRNYETCQCVETPEDTPECPSGQHYHWGFLKCVPDVVCPGGQYHNGEKCVDKVQPPEAPPSTVDPKNTPTPTPERPADPPAPAPEQPTPEPATPRSTDPWTAAVKDAVDRTNQILKDTQADLAKQKTDLTWIQSTMATVNENLGKAIIAIQRNGAEIAGRVETSISNGIGKVVNAVRSSSDSIKGAISGLGTSISNLGTNIANGLTDVKTGITAKLTEVATQMTNLGTQVTGAVNGVKDGIIDAIGNLRGQLTGIDAGIGNVTEELRKINEGSYVTPADKEPYVAPEHDFNLRTTQFLETVKTSPIFAIPNQLSTSIPGGGSPILSINTGSTYGGEVQIDFSELSNALLVLRALFQIMGITIAIRIITLKR